MVQQHVLPQGKNWAVKKEGAKRASKLFPRKDQAVRYAQKLSANQGTYVYVHQSDGTIETVLDDKVAPVPASKSRVETQHRIHVLKDKNGGWKVKTEGTEKAIKSFSTKYSAIRFAHKTADRRKAAMVIHDKKNRITHIDIPPHFRSPLSALLHLR